MSKIGKITTKTPETKREDSVSKAKRTDFSQSVNSPVDHILHLQRTIGNQAVQRLFKSGVLHAKLKIGKPGNKYEREADSVAERVTSEPEPDISRQEDEEEVQTKPLADQITPLVQRQSEEEEEIKKQPEEEEEPVQTKLLQRQPEDEEEVQKQPEEEEEEAAAQAKFIQRQEEGEEVQPQAEEEEESVQAKGSRESSPDMSPSVRDIVWNHIQAAIYRHYSGWVKDSWLGMNHKLTVLMRELDGLVEAAKAESKAAAAVSSSFLTLVNAITKVGGDILAAGLNQYYNRLIDLDWRGVKERIPKLRDEVWKKLEPQAGKFQAEADRFIEDPRVIGLFDAAYNSYAWNEHNDSERAEFYRIFSRENWCKMRGIYESSYTLQWEEFLNSTIGAAVKRNISSKIFEDAKPFSVDDIKVPKNLSPKKIKQFVKDAKLAQKDVLRYPVSHRDALYIRSGYSMIYWQVVQESAPAVFAFKQELDNAEAGRWIGGLSRQALKIFDATDNFFALDEVASPLFGTLEQIKKLAPIIDLYGIGQSVDEAIQEIAKLRTYAALKALDTKKQLKKYFKLEMSAKHASYKKCMDGVRKDYSGRRMRPGETVPYDMCHVPRPFLGFHGEYRNAAIRHGVL